MRLPRARVCTFAAPLLLAACSLSDQSLREHVGRSTSALTKSKGLFASPTNVQSGVLKRDGNGLILPAWGGSLADLVAADALGACNDFPNGTAIDDAYVRYLRGLMANASCDAAPVHGAPSDPGVWRSQRATATCNVDTSANASMAVPLFSHDRSTYALTAPPASAVTGEVDPAQATASAQVYVDTAEVNLCMAQAARESMLTAPGLLLSTRDQLELLEFIRERSQLAMVQYTMLGLAFGAEDGAPDNLTYGSNCVETDQCLFAIPLLHAWAKQPGSAASLAAMGGDFASAVALHTSTVEDLADSFVRNASARANRNAVMPADIDWGATSWRSRLLALLYGGDPLGPSSAGSDSMWQYFPGTPGATLPPALPYVSHSLSGVATNAILGLARSADAFFLKADGDFASRTQATRDQVYRTLEASVRFPECTHAGEPGIASAPCSVRATDPAIPSMTNYTSSFIWQRYQVAPQDVANVVSALFDAFPGASSGGQPNLGGIRITGQTQQLTGAALTARLPLGTGTWVHVDPSWQSTPPTLPERARPFLRSFVVPPALYKRVVPAAQGFFDGGPESARLVGAAGALSAVRDALQRASFPDADGRSKFFAPAKGFVKVIDGEIGTDSLAVRRGLSLQCATPTECALAPVAQGATWTVERTVPSGSAATSLVTVPTTGFESTLARDPSAVAPGAESAGAALKTATAVPATSSTSLPNGTERRVFPVAAAGTVSILASDPSGPQAMPARLPYRLLADGVVLGSATDSADATSGVAVSLGGRLGHITAQAWSGDAQEWSVPARDALGFALGWVPSMDPSLTGNATLAGAVTGYLGIADKAARDATAQMQAAITNLINQRSDQDLLKAARDRSAALATANAQSLCGTAVATCDTAAVTVPFITPNDCPQPAGPAPTVAAVTSEYCPVLDMLNAVVPRTVTSTQTLINHLNDTAPNGPPFAEYGGGTLQSAMVAQWSAARGMVNAWSAAKATLASQMQAVVTASLQQGIASDPVECQVSSFNRAAKAGMGFIPTTSKTGLQQQVTPNLQTGIDGSWSVQYSSMSWSPGPLEAQAIACAQARQTASTAPSTYASARLDAWKAIQEQIALVATASGNLATASAGVFQAITTAATATARDAAESTFQSNQAQSRIGLRLRFYSEDLEDARNAMRKARIAALTARRVIEAVYLVDLSRIYEGVAGVPAPATWADDVFSPDLDGPGNLNLLPPPPATSPYDSNRLVTYVSNLSAFATGYASAHPTVAAQPDVDILTIADPDVRVGAALGPDAARWAFQCPNLSWVPHPGLNVNNLSPNVTVAHACGAGAAGRPLRARVTFTVDPWGRLNGSVTAPPAGGTSYSKRYNTRLARLGVYFQGLGIKDCSSGTDPEVCQAARFLNYDFTAVGPAWATDFNELWHGLAVPTGYIEGAKGDTGDTVLDAVMTHGALLNDVGRTELATRPIGDMYILDIDASPDVVRLENLARVQIAVEKIYWEIQ